MTNRESELLTYLRAALPLADRIALSEEDMLRTVRHALAVRAQVPWGERIPESIFRAYVVFPRVNNEDPVFYQGPLWERIEPRIRGMELMDAAIEVNYFAASVATYQSTDDRTANALTVLTRAYGRCGEESVLLVSALRSAGIPARQVYSPRWAHCDDNHAWVEVWVDGVWRYMGACEPEPVLDSGWFTAAASKAMLVSTRAYGVDPEGDRIEHHIGNAALVNSLESYAETTPFTLEVTRGGAPAEGLQVDLELVNGSEFISIDRQSTGPDGRIHLLTGKGSLRIHVTDGERYLARMTDTETGSLVQMDFDGAEDFHREAEAYRQQPPVETRIQPADYGEELTALHSRRAARAEADRAAWEGSFRTDNDYFTHARGNHGVIAAFLADGRFAMEDKTALLDTLAPKDFVDATLPMLEDALTGALPYKGDYPAEIWREGVLCPRVSIEMLYPHRAHLAAEAAGAGDAAAVWALLKARMQPAEMDPVTLIPRLTAVWDARLASDTVMDALFVALCRSLGIAARLNPASGEKEYWREGWRSLLPGRQCDARLVLTNPGEKELFGYAHFSVARLEDGVFRTMKLYGVPLGRRLELPVMSGCYRVTTATRQIDGSVDGWLLPVEIAAGESVEVPVIMGEDRTPQLRLSKKLGPVTTDQGVLEMAGAPSIFALLDPGAEPTEHLLNELLEAREEIAAAGVRLYLAVGPEGDTANEKLRIVLDTLPEAALYTCPDGETVTLWRRKLRAGDLRLPLAIAVDADGVGRYAFTNYNVGSVRSLMQILSHR